MIEKIKQNSSQYNNFPIVHQIGLFIGFGILIYFLTILWTGWEQTAVTIEKIGAGVLFLGAISAASNYIWRFGRWHYILHQLSYHPPIWINFRVYLSGLALTTSPGKAGETVRSLLLIPYGVKISHSLSAFLVDRLSDVLGVTLLGVIAGIFTSNFNWTLIIIFTVILVVSLLLSYSLSHTNSTRLWNWLTLTKQWLPVKSGQATLESWAKLWSPRRVCLFTLIAVAAYGTQAMVFAWFCWRADIDIPLVNAVVIFANATLFGAASMIPGGLGAMEASLVFQLTKDYATPEAIAVSVAIAIRLVTLWLGIVLGAVSLMSLAGNVDKKITN